MNILFLTMSQFNNIYIHNIYADLMLTFINNGHRPYIVSPFEKRFAQKTQLFEFSDYVNLKVQVGNMSNVSKIKKGLSTLRLDHQFNAAIKKHFSNIKFDLILYSTPPITLAGVVKKQKARHHAPTYLLLKDIFPQNAVDLCMLHKGGILHRYFLRKEKQLYALSDNIGCMSPANVDYLLKHNPEIKSDKVCVAPNSIIVEQISRSESSRRNQREKYGIPQNAVVFIYGGNMGEPQDIPFVVRCLKKLENRSDCYFIMCGTGNYYSILERYAKENAPSNVLIINGLPKTEYDALLQACDVGLLFLDHRFTIPNFPSRMLSYMEQSMPILACTDRNTDVGKIITDAGFGWWCESNDSDAFAELVEEILSGTDTLTDLGIRTHDFLIENYQTESTYEKIVFGSLTRDKSAINAKVCLIAPGNLFSTPYINKYLEVLKVPFDIVYWNERSIYELCNAEKKYILRKSPIIGASTLKKIIGYLRFRHMAIKALTHNDYKRVVLLTGNTAVLLKRVLLKKYSGKYLVDIRDYYKENMKCYYNAEKELIENSYLTVISSKAYEIFLPKFNYLVTHNITWVTLEKAEEFRNRKRDAESPLVLSFIGNMRFEEQVKRVLFCFSNDERYHVRLIGNGYGKFIKYCEDLEIGNVSIIDWFPPEKTIEYYYDTDIVLNLYGNGSPLLDYALSNKLYYSAQFGKPILVCPNTYMETVASSYCFGFTFDLDDPLSKDKLYFYYENIEWEKLYNDCDIFLQQVLSEEQYYFEQLSEFFNI